MLRNNSQIREEFIKRKEKYTIPGILILIEEYKLFGPETKMVLDLNICGDADIAVSYQV